jgi:TatD DNase family protein
MLADTHAHLCDPAFQEDLERVLERARSADVGRIIGVGESLQDARRNLELAREFDMVAPAAGLYPSLADPELAREMAELIRENSRVLAAIGEVGLDYWLAQDELARETQLRTFDLFIDLSLELGLPLNVHSRSAGRHAVGRLLEKNARLVQMHAFDGKAAAAMPAVEAGYFFSVPPSAVRSRQKQKLVKQLPLACILLETDSPVLGPVPGSRNEPANLAASMRAVAEIKGISPEEVREAAAENTRTLYGELSRP